jgi:hypothetical protein
VVFVYRKEIDMNVLVACEESQRVCTAFRAKGHNAFSCDILPCSGGHPEWHCQGDVLNILNGSGDKEEYFCTQDNKSHKLPVKWDLIIAHPPCTYLSNAGARFLYPKGVLNQDRLKLGLAAKEFFMAFYNADCEKICIENPTPSRVYELPKYTQVIQPWMFGHPVQKRTCLWLKGLEPLKPTEIVEERQSSKVPGNWFNKGGKERQQNRAKTFLGIAKAMASQWSDV